MENNCKHRLDDSHTNNFKQNYSHHSLKLVLGYPFIPHWKQAQISQACLELSQHVKGAEWCVYVCQ